ncbi:hypothetical protein AX15_005312 [Amanita polypyramis BW_CC]|nr:hypothetical protein AX15_005312 [Amanita polypyramis BW_CC]
MSADIDAKNLLEAALDHAFSPPSLRDRVPGPSVSETEKNGHEEVAQAQAPERRGEEDRTSIPDPAVDTWKVEYDEQVRTWRAQSAEAREKAENERARWEGIRAVEKKEAAQKESESRGSEWDEKKGEGYTVVPTVPDRSLETHGELEAHTQADMTDDLQKWEDIHSSATSSFPSMSFPERISTPSPTPAQYRVTEPSRTATLAIFDSSLSTRTRVKALLASLAINLLLPFVNGVMLGFGEVFAKEVIVGWFGWKKPGSIAASAGLRTSSQRQRWSN